MWCFTEKQDPSKVIPSEFGSHIFGFVTSPLGDSGTFTGKYTIKVYSAASRFGDSDGTMSMIMMGDVSISDEITVSTNGFTRGQIHEMSTSQGIVGNVMMLQIKMTNPEARPYACVKIEIVLT